MPSQQFAELSDAPQLAIAPLPPAYHARVIDAFHRLMRGEPDRDIRSIHGYFVLRDARERAAIARKEISARQEEERRELLLQIELERQMARQRHADLKREAAQKGWETRRRNAQGRTNVA